MISEKDLKDFKDIDCTKARQAVMSVCYYHAGDDQYKRGVLYLAEMIEKIELLQHEAVKQIPALFKPKE